MPDKIIQSKALEANLNQTKNIEYVIPDEHLWFLTLSEKYWGIHKKAQAFITEYHHPYSNRKEVIDLLVNVSISDFWIYRELPEHDRVLQMFFEIYDKLLQEDLSEELAKHLIFICLEFFDKNYSLISRSDSSVLKFLHLLDKNFEAKYFFYLSNLGYFKKSLNQAAQNAETEKPVKELMRKLLAKNISFWESTSNIEAWYDRSKTKMSRDYTAVIKTLGKDFFRDYHDKLQTADSWEQLCRIAFTFSDIIDAFRKIIDDFQKATEQFSYIFYLLHLPGVVYHRNYLLLDLNAAIKRISSELDEVQCISAIDELFALFADFKQSHSGFILDSILTLGKEIINTQNTKLIHYFEDRIIKFGFISAGTSFFTNNWELKVDSNHIKNIRIWLELIEYDPETMKKLLSALIINLRLGGIFIFDTDLFQKDVTKLLNARISPIYKQIKQLTRIFPVFFNEIGAEGHLRDVSTQIDELSHRNDKLIHFLRKQIHTEGNNSHIYITLEIIRFWHDLNKDRLKKIVPLNVFETIDLESIWVQGVHKFLTAVCHEYNLSLEVLLAKEQKELRELFSQLTPDHENDRKRLNLIIELYQLLKEKYLFEADDIGQMLRRYHFIENKDIARLESLLRKNKNFEALKLIYSFMVKLNEIIFDPAISEGWESIYYKRHIAFGIPSMYGQYREAKFDALGLTFRLELVASVLVNNIIGEINVEYFTAKTLKDIFWVMQLLREGLSLDGIYDQGFESNLKMFQYSLTSQSFTITQYINIFMFMETSIKEIINKYFLRPYDQLLQIIIPQQAAQGKKISPDITKKKIVQKSEIFYRELITSAFLIQSLDNFIGKVLNNLRKMVSTLSEVEIKTIMTYDPDMVLTPIYRDTPSMDNQVFLGSKAYYLKEMYRNNFPVPPGFVITTEVFRRINSIQKISALNNEIDRMIKFHISELEKLSGLKFGDAEKPLLLSVRSGAAISMPGAMNTFLNVGLNDKITEHLSKQYNFGWTSWDCYRRLLQTWGMSYGLDRNDFDQIMKDYKQKYNVAQKIDFAPKIMREIAFAYKKLLTDNNIKFESSPFLQIKEAIISVFKSWDTDRAKVYREHLQIAEEWGTAVIVQQMVFGNIHRESGSGVLFTHDYQDNVPGINLAGDFSFLSQGEDIVAGLVTTLPISEKQRLKYYHKSPFSLETAFPKIYRKLLDIARELIEVHSFGHQEIEFTFEKAEPEDLYILQTRDMPIMKQTKIEMFALPEKKMLRVGCGIGIGNKVLNGVIIFDQEDLQALRKTESDKPTVLVRPDTVPDDIEMIFECEGLLTAKGGATSHAAVTASTLGKICIVNCDDMLVFEKEKKCIINGHVFVAFDPIAIDAKQGIVYKGNYPIKIQQL